jgi:hypothetical protein
VVWASGSEPTLYTNPDSVNIFTFFTIDGGTTWFGASAGGNNVLFTISLYDTATSTTNTISYPSGIEVGDLAILCQSASNYPSTIAASTPTGYTFVETSGGGGGGGWNVVMGLYYKVIESGDIDGSVTCVDGSAADHNVIYIIRGSKSISSVTIDSNSSITNGNPSTITASSTGMTGPVLAVGMACAQETTATFTTETPSLTNKQAAEPMACGIVLYDEGDTLSDQSVDKGDQAGNNGLIVALFEIS